MKITNLFEASQYDIFSLLMRDCKPFAGLSKHFEYVPVRRQSLNYNDGEVFTNVFRFKTQPNRKSILYGDSDDFLIMDEVVKAYGNASRRQHMVATSSIGENYDFGVSKDDDLAIIPIGDFTYSYVDDDFNHHTVELFEAHDIEIRYIVGYLEDQGRYDASLLTDLRKLYTVYESTVKEVDESDDDDIAEHLSDVREMLQDWHEFFDSIMSEKYVNAFNSEHEIWFNCKSYYAIPYRMFEAIIRGDYDDE